MTIPTIRVTREEMRKRVTYFKDLTGFDGGLIDSHFPGSERVLYNALGFQPPQGKQGTNIVSPVGAQAASNAAVRINEGFNIGFCEARPGHGPLMQNHDTNETFMPLTGQWRCSWEVNGRAEHFDGGQWDIVSFPAGVNRRFVNVTEGDPNTTHWLLFVIGGDAPQAEFSDEAKATLCAAGILA
jgi:hypothetical protein